jgi:predicted ATPase
MRRDKSLNEKLFDMAESNVLEPYIRYIRFPKFKNLEPNAHIDFRFPLTVLVGENGTNKTSILRALQGSPGMNNIGNYWFSTELDPIFENRVDRQCFIYGYRIPGEEQLMAEVLKTRIKRGNNPDYWEPSRPIKKYDMASLPESKIYSNFVHRTRWKNIEKNVVYIDFRENLCAYDRYFYFGTLKKTKNLNTKQDRIREWSRHLKIVAEKNQKSHQVFCGKTGYREKILQNKILPADVTKIISDILDKDYNSIRMIGHSFFDSSEGTTILFGSTDQGYSEAFAGSGESAITMMIADIFNCPEKSLILLDEPETSLHPGAQEKLKRYLLEGIKTKHHQVIISTHSPIFVEDLPQAAIKVLFCNSTGKISVCNEALPQEAFHILGFHDRLKITVYVEDNTAKLFLDRVLEHILPNLKGSFNVIPFSGGVGQIIQCSLIGNAINGIRNVFYLFDGDQRPDEDFCAPESIAEDQYEEKLRIYLHEENLRLPVDSDATLGHKNQERQKKDFMRRILFYLYEGHLKYFPFETPEKFLLKNKNIPCEAGDANGKKTINHQAESHYDSEALDSSAILNFIRGELAMVSIDHDVFKQITKILSEMVKTANNFGEQP